MTIIGITGGSGVGKTTALATLADMGAYSIDCDAVYHELLQQNQAMTTEIGEKFPAAIQNGAINRKQLGTLVFSDKQALLDLNYITHKYVKQAVIQRIAARRAKGNTRIALEAVALIESGLADLCAITVGLVAPLDMRIARIVAREHISEAYAHLRIQSQQPDTFYHAHCDMVINNNTQDVAEFAAMFREAVAAALPAVFAVDSVADTQ